VSNEGKILPQAVDLEQAVLGAVLICNTAITKVIDVLKPEMFYRESHQKVFASFERLYAAGEPIDFLTVTNDLNNQKDGVLESIGGGYFISCLSKGIAADTNIEFHARIIIQKWVLRQIIYQGQLAVNRAYNDDPDIFSVLDDIGDLLLMRDKLVTGSKEVPAVSFIVDKEIEDYDLRVAANQSGKVLGIPTGFQGMDKLTMGWQGGKLIILAARPAMGKSALVGGFSLTSAKVGVPVAFFSLEMPEIELVQRFLTDLGEIDNHQYQRGMLIPQDLEKLYKARLKLTTLPIYIDDTPTLSITALRAKARRLKQKNNIGMIVVDYLQLMEGKPGEKKSGNREQEISGISRGLKAIAKELDVPVVALSQLSRAVETRGGDKRPQLSDLRESGAIEQDADMVIFLHRPEYYKQDQYEDGESTKDVAEIIIAKHRGGQLGTEKVKFIANQTKFTDFGLETYTPKSLSPNRNFYEPKRQTDIEEDPF
jgi:replicative DNA helicase